MRPRSLHDIGSANIFKDPAGRIRCSPDRFKSRLSVPLNHQSSRSKGASLTRLEEGVPIEGTLDGVGAEGSCSISWEPVDRLLA